MENYRGVDEACSQLTGRSESERQRFLSRYGADKTDLRNCDLVCDTTSAAPEQVVARIVEVLDTPASTARAPLCLLDPGRVRRTARGEAEGEVEVCYRAPDFFVVGGDRRLTEAVRAGETLTPMILADQPGKPTR